MNDIKINHSEIKTDFLNYLDLKENNRILFTAPFGTGKSTFLQEVFDDNSQYFTISLFPVNYSVSANEDVFELIKFDILIEILGNYKEAVELNEDFSALLLSQMFVLKELKLTPIIFAILKQCGKIGKSAVDIVEEVKKQYAVFKDKMKNDENEAIVAFMDEIQNQKGSEHEMDSISTLIKNLISQVKEKKKQQSVLVIDDLDRLDPEHTFRLFNIFSAHFDKIDNSNKFSFDKVIFVYDFENIKKIFHYRYGEDVDFSGYSDKFFSLAPYQFDNRQYVKEKIGKIFDEIKYTHTVDRFFYNNDRFFVTTKALIQSLIDTRQLNLRMLLNYPELRVPDKHFGKNQDVYQKICQSSIVVIFYLLKNFYGSFEVLYSKLKYLFIHLGATNLSSSNSDLYFVAESTGIINMVISYCLPFLLPDSLAFKSSGTEIQTYYSPKYDCIFHFNDFPNSFNAFKNFQKVTKGDNENSEEIVLNPYQILLDVFDSCKKLGAFK